jgi:hypothetical protein
MWFHRTSGTSTATSRMPLGLTFATATERSERVMVPSNDTPEPSPDLGPAVDCLWRAMAKASLQTRSKSDPTMPWAFFETSWTNDSVRAVEFARRGGDVSTLIFICDRSRRKMVSLSRWEGTESSISLSSLPGRLMAGSMSPGEEVVQMTKTTDSPLCSSSMMPSNRVSRHDSSRR